MADRRHSLIHERESHLLSVEELESEDLEIVVLQLEGRETMLTEAYRENQKTKVRSLVKTRTRHPRRSKARDRRVIAEIWGSSGIAFDEGDGGPSASATHPRSKSHQNDNRQFPRWADTNELLKASVFNETLGEYDNGRRRAISLNISDDVIRQTLADKKQGFAAHILDRIRRALKRAGKPEIEMWIVVERCRGNGRLHIHGGCACTDNDLPAVERALKAAGGDWDDGKQGRQLDMKDQDDPAGWVRYCLKDLSRTRKDPSQMQPDVRGSMIARTGGLGRQAEAIYEEWRQSQKARDERRRKKGVSSKRHRTRRRPNEANIVHFLPAMNLWRMLQRGPSLKLARPVRGRSMPHKRFQRLWGAFARPPRV